MPSETETNDACAKWYGSTPVPKPLVAAWFAGHTAMCRPILEGYMTAEQAATRLGIKPRQIWYTLDNRASRRAAFPGSIRLKPRMRWYLPPAEVEAYRVPKPVDTLQAVFDTFHTLQAECDAPIIEAINRRLGYNESLVSKHLRMLQKEGVVTGDVNGGFVVHRPQQSGEQEAD